MATGPQQRQKEIDGIKHFVHKRKHDRFQVANNRKRLMFFDPCTDKYIVTDLLKNQIAEAETAEAAYKVWA